MEFCDFFVEGEVEDYILNVDVISVLVVLFENSDMLVDVNKFEEVWSLVVSFEYVGVVVEFIEWWVYFNLMECFVNVNW